jgi:hypothetical protein
MHNCGVDAEGSLAWRAPGRWRRTRGQSLGMAPFSRADRSANVTTHAGVHPLDRASLASAPQRAMDRRLHRELATLDRITPSQVAIRPRITA